MTNEKFYNDEKIILELLQYNKNFRCPKCNENTVKYMPESISKEEKVFFPRKMLKTYRYHCFNCKNGFGSIKKLALVDGIFLDKNTDLKQRSKRYVEEICKESKLSDDVKNYAFKILTDYNKKLGYRNTATAAVYISAILCNERRTQMELEDITHVTDISFRNSYKDIKKVLDLKIS